MTGMQASLLTAGVAPVKEWVDNPAVLPCTANPRMWDGWHPDDTTVEARSDRLARAQAACRTCPALAHCTDWAATIPDPQRTLVTAGRPPAEPSGRRCSVVGCGRRHQARGYCGPHLSRVRKHGDPQAHIPIGNRHTTIARAEEALARGLTPLQATADLGLTGSAVRSAYYRSHRAVPDVWRGVP